MEEIVVLRSPRAKVEKLLGRGRGEEHAFIAYYPISEGSLHIDYSDGSCKPGQYRAWKVPVEVVYTPLNSPPKFTSLNLDLKKCRTVRESPDVPDLITYIGDTDGVAYMVQLDGTVSEIRYFPSTQHDGLRCSK
jgi:hypothetical protein